MKLKSFQIKIAFFLFISFFLASGSFYGYQVFYASNVLINSDTSKVLLIPENADFEQVTDSLKKQKILQDKLSFMFLSKLMKYRDNVKAGRYELTPGMSNYELISKLRAGKQDPVQLTIHNIRSKEELADKIGRQLALDSTRLIQTLNDSSKVSQYGFDTVSVITMFLPNTYEIYWNIGLNNFLDRMHDEYENFWTEERIAQSKKIGLNPFQVAILASIVQAETNIKSEMPRIAGVYINRLRNDQKLQADPTIKYALNDFSIKRVLNKHTRVNSPYNTYQNKGLPPGPINLASITAIKAVLNYEKHDYMFFCASPEFDGSHIFARSYQAHIINANKYRQALDERNITQ